MGIEPSCRASEKDEFWQKGVLVWQEVSLSNLFLADRKTKISFSVLLQSRLFFTPIVRAWSFSFGGSYAGLVLTKLARLVTDNPTMCTVAPASSATPAVSPSPRLPVSPSPRLDIQNSLPATHPPFLPMFSVELTHAEVGEFDAKLAQISNHRPQYRQNMRAAIGKAVAN